MPRGRSLFLELVRLTGHSPLHRLQFPLPGACSGRRLEGTPLARAEKVLDVLRNEDVYWTLE